MRVFLLLGPLLMLLCCAAHGETILVVHGMLPTPPPEALRAELDEVWIDSTVSEGPVEYVMTPAIGRWSGLGRGAGGGAIWGCAILGWPVLTGEPSGFAIGVVGCAGGAAVGALSGGIYGAVAAKPRKSTQKAIAILHETMGRNASPLELRDRVRALARRNAVGRIASAPDAATIRLEISLTSIRLELGYAPHPDSPQTEFHAGVIDPELRLGVTAEAKLLRSNGAEELYSAQLEHWGGRRTVPHWAADKGAPLRREIDYALDDLAEQIVDSIFLLHREP